MLAEPYARRRDLLENPEPGQPGLRVPPTGDSVAEAYGWTREHRLEGVIARHGDSRYLPGARSRDWIKIEHLRAADVVIGGRLPAGPGAASVRAVLT
ncbi:hypothetical protein ACFYUY_33540 [Kitasatospora sp. NPDC004745]|uniref:ATP-dependent DNA ligase n=1 Tax=unclassified Kitasatospora TaxID=2633591 RepID=UPI0033C193E3